MFSRNWDSTAIWSPRSIKEGIVLFLVKYCLILKMKMMVNRHWNLAGQIQLMVLQSLMHYLSTILMKSNNKYGTLRLKGTLLVNVFNY